jgi:penicillin-binding protein 1A
MSYAHQGLEIKPLPGLPLDKAPPTPAKNQVASQAAGTPVLRPTLLTARGTEVLIRIEHLMDDAARALPAGAAVSDLATDPVRPADIAPRTDATKPDAPKTDAFASAGAPVRGN